MTKKSHGVGTPADARQVFRQFAWHLAGTLTQRKTQPTPSNANRARTVRASRAAK